MSKKGEITDRVRQMLEVMAHGASNHEIASRFRVSLRNVRDVRLRYDVPRMQPGRPQLATPLTTEQQSLVEEYMKFAAGCARRACRDKSRAYEWDESEYISCGYLGLVKAASRWEGRGRFKRLVAAYVDGVIRDYRRADMFAHGWTWDGHAHFKMRQVARFSSWPRSRKDGSPQDIRRASVQMGSESVSSISVLSESF